MSAREKFRFVATDRRVSEDRRFVVGKGRFAADIVPQGLKHVALVSSPHPAARIVSIDKSAALAMPGVHCVLDGYELAAATEPLAAGLDTPNVPRRPLAVDVARYAGEWVAAVVADSRALAEDGPRRVTPQVARSGGEDAWLGGRDARVTGRIGSTDDLVLLGRQEAHYRRIRGSRNAYDTSTTRFTVK